MNAISGEKSCKAEENAMSDKKAHRNRVLKRVSIGVCVFVIVVAFLIALIVFASAQGWIFVSHAA